MIINIFNSDALRVLEFHLHCAYNSDAIRVTEFRCKLSPCRAPTPSGTLGAVWSARRLGDPSALMLYASECQINLRLILCYVMN